MNIKNIKNITINYLREQPKWLFMILILLLILLLHSRIIAIILLIVWIALSYFIKNENKKVSEKIKQHVSDQKITELKRIAQKLKIPNYGSYTRGDSDKLKRIILNPKYENKLKDELKDKLNLSWWNKNSNTVLAIISIALTVIGLIMPVFSNKPPEYPLPKERYSSNVLLLGSSRESDRIDGAKGLYELANEYPQEYQDSVCAKFCEYVRDATFKEKSLNERQAIIELLLIKKTLINSIPKNSDAGNNRLTGVSSYISRINQFFQKKYEGYNQGSQGSQGIFLFDLCKKNLKGVFLSGVDFSGAKLCNVDFSDSELSNIKFAYAELNNIAFRNATLNNVCFGDNIKLGGYFQHNKAAKLNNVDFRSATLRNINFYDAKLSNAYFLDTELDSVDFRNATLSTVDFQSALLNNINFESFKFDSNDYMKLCDINFKDTALEGYHYNEITSKGRSLELTKQKKEILKKSKKITIEKHKKNSATSNEQISDSIAGVVINGVRWATRNVGTIIQNGYIIRKFADKPEDAGEFYQWNRLKVESAGHKIRNKNPYYESGYSVSHWKTNYDPSPAGWRVPTVEEIESLLDEDKVSNEWTVLNGKNGRKFTDKTTGNSIFLPAVGYNNINITTRGNLGASGHYWSCTNNGIYYYAYDLFFHCDNIVKSTSHKGNSLSIRSVSTSKPVTGVELSQSIITLSPNDTLRLKATVHPSNASNKTLIWSSSSTDVVTVNSSGFITAVAAGIATITVYTKDENKADTCTIIVNSPLKSTTSVFTNLEMKINTDDYNRFDEIRAVVRRDGEEAQTVAKATYGRLIFKDVSDNYLHSYEEIWTKQWGDWPMWVFHPDNIAELKCSNPIVRLAIATIGIYKQNKMINWLSSSESAGLVYSNADCDIAGITTLYSTPCVVDIRLRKGWNMVVYEKGLGIEYRISTKLIQGANWYLTAG